MENEITPIIGQKVRFVKMYKCDICGTEFDEPRIRTFCENLDGENGWEWRKEVTCPICCQPYFRLAENDDFGEGQ